MRSARSGLGYSQQTIEPFPGWHDPKAKD